MSVTAAAMEEAMHALASSLRSRCAEIDRLNVFPVADGDTGTNLLHTVDAVITALGDAQGGRWEAIRRGALVGSRGSSGIIFAQALRGLCDVLEAGGSAAEALQAASRRAYAAVSHPVEGTILTVARAAATGAAARPEDPLGAALEAGRETLDRTPEMLPALAGLVDAGGLGFVLFLEALAGEVSVEGGVTTGRAGPSDGGRVGGYFEVMVMVAGDDTAISALRRAWEEIGDAVAIAGDRSGWKCHVHTDRPEEALEVARRIVAVGSHQVSPLPP